MICNPNFMISAYEYQYLNYFFWFSLANLLIPLLVVVVYYRYSVLKSTRDHKVELFETLAATSPQKLKVSKEHTLALNKIQIVFYNNKKVLLALKQYIEVFEVQNYDEVRGNRLYYVLLEEMGKALKIKVDINSLKSLAYIPQSLANELDAISKIINNIINNKDL